MTLPNPENFSVNERSDEYNIKFEITGTMTMTVNAVSETDAKEKAEEEADLIMDAEVDLDEVEDVKYFIRKCKPMYRVLRDGQKMQTTRLEPGDEPREPDERGF